MFVGVISRDNGCPWGETGMSTARWASVPVWRVTIASLVATQPQLLIRALRPDAPAPYAGDPYPHVICWGGVMYLEDGHHRVVRAALAGARTIAARVLVVGDGPAPTKEQAMILCGNPAHPAGPWHDARPLPATWDVVGRVRRALRRRRFGCGCDPRAESFRRQRFHRGGLISTPKDWRL